LQEALSGQTTEVDLAKKWFTNLVTYFRREYDSLSDDEKKFVSNTSNYLAPCQIELIWLGQPEHQFVITSHFADRPDMEVVINGPYSGEEFIQKMEELLASPRWNKQLRDGRMPGATGYAELLASHLNAFMNDVRDSVFGPATPGPRFGMMADGIWAQAYAGNVTKTDYVSVVNTAIADLRARHTSSLSAPAQPPPQKEPERDGFLTFFYPPIVFGKRPRPTVVNILRGMTFAYPPQGKEFDARFHGKDIIVNKSGLVFVAEKNAEEALRVLNTIMAVGTLRGLDLYAVRENELGQGNYDRENKELKGSSYSLSSLRMMQADVLGRRIVPSTEIDPKRLQSVISEADSLYSNAKLVEELRLFIESYTHLSESEYAQSFILSWTIIERYLYEVWHKKIMEMDIDEERHSKLLNTVQWSTDYVLEVLNMTHDVSEGEYEEFMELKHKRNRFTHKGKPVSKEDAERCIKTAREIVARKSGIQPQ
jgi:hypothetical protein